MATRAVTPDEVRAAQRLSATARHAGFLWQRELDDGRLVRLVAMSHGTTRITIGDRDACVVDDVWCFQDDGAAWAAVLGWDGEGEPSGWYRHPGTRRRRADGTAATEVVGL